MQTGVTHMDKEKLLEFSCPYYANKDIMHNMWHIELVEKYVNKIIEMGCYDVNVSHITYATYFHGFIYNAEHEVSAWLVKQNLPDSEIDQIVKIAYESQREETPGTLEGKILHDAHIIEGGKTYLITKCLITGSVRGQSLLETIDYIETNIIDKAVCYLPETIPLLNKANLFTRKFIADLKAGIS